VSTEIFCTRFERADLAVIPTKSLELAFEDFTATSLGYEIPGSLASCRLFESLSFSVAEGGASGFAVGRPSTDIELYEALFLLLRLEGVVVYAPGSPPIVGNPASIAHLPESMLESLGCPVLTGSSVQLLAELFAEPRSAA
jgi:hypothetical protein